MQRSGDWSYHAPRYRTVADYEYTFGPEVGKFVTQVGLEPDPEQQDILDAIFAVNSEGSSACYETGVIGPRQAMKTGVGMQAALGWTFLPEVRSVKRDNGFVTTWSAHQFATAAQTFSDMQSIIEGSSALRRRMPAPRRSRDVIGGVHGHAGMEGFTTKAGDELRFRARTREGARGLTGDKVVLDEGFALEESHMGSLLPTLTVVPDPQLLILSSAGMVKSAVLRDMRDRGRQGSPRMAYFEWCAEHRPCRRQRADGKWVVNPGCTHPKPSDPDWRPGCALDDEELWRQAYPLLGRVRANGTSLTLAKLRDFRRSEPSAEWARERLGWWDDPGAGDLFGPGNWEKCAGTLPDGAPLYGLGVAVSYDLSRAAVVGATGTKQHPSVRVLGHDLGYDWVRPQLEKLKSRFPRVRIVMDKKGPSSALYRDIVQGDRTAAIRLKPEAVTLDQLMDGCADLFLSVVESRFTHENDKALNSAAESVTRRDVGDRWLWGRKASESDISPLEAASLSILPLAEEERRSSYSGHGVLTV